MVQSLQLPRYSVLVLRRILRRIQPLRSAAAVLEPASPDDGTALGLQCMLRGSCHIQAFGRVEDLSYITGRHGSASQTRDSPIFKCMLLLSLGRERM
ncbi:unnamed protein product [Durusdinium trenchii]|uniref:Uncharacterized protein n=1 Tax=Durusdinium trenchii TaxID=1381693 RepID=A0ABP0RS41_9DINO